MKYRDSLSVSPAAAFRPPTRFAAWLIQHAARQAPSDLAPRLEEEWLADLHAQSGVLAQLRFAMGCCWATQVIAHNPVSFGAVVGSAAGGHGTIAALASHDGPPCSRRSTIILLVLALHGAVISAFFTGVIPPVGAPPPGPIQTRFLAPIKEPPLAPPGPSLQFREWNPVPPNPDVQPNVPPLTGERQELVLEPSQLAPSQPHSVVRVQGGPGEGFPSTEIFYPAASRRLEETGASAVRVCVDGRGRLTGDPTITDSSGSMRLDAGALALAKAGSGHYRSTTEDGKAVTSCFAYRVRFSLRQ